MPLETATYINQLDSANPLGSDPIAAGDDHIRLIKSAVKATFPNITGPVNLTQAQINALPSEIDAVEASVASLSSSTSASLATKADKATTVTGTGGLTGGGDLSANRSLSIADSGVSTAKIADAAVTSAKLASGVAVANIGYTPVNPSAFTGSNQSLNTNGFQRLPGGLIFQWCESDAGSGERDISLSFPITFPTAVLQVVVGTQVTGSPGDLVAQLISKSTSGCSIRFNGLGANDNARAIVFAIGY